MLKGYELFRAYTYEEETQQWKAVLKLKHESETDPWKYSSRF